jgi:broad specificity phosphatase PhoE
MPRPRLGPLPLTAAQRQARRRAKQRLSRRGHVAAPAPRPQRWAAAVATLVELQQEYAAWLDSLPEGLEGSRTAEKLEAITELDLDELQEIDPPRGYGRD